jgi:hypothetical protein
MRPFMPPAWTVRILERLRNAVFSLYQALLPGQVNLTEMIGAAWFAQAIHAAAELGIADILADGPATAAQIAERVHASPDAVERLLRLLASRKVFAQQRDGRYRLNRNARPLRSGPGSLRGFALFAGSPAHREHWSGLANAIRTGSPAVETVRGEPFFSYIHRDRQLAALFEGSMTGISALITPLTLAAYDFRRFPVIADIGGGDGQFLAEILASAPGSRGILFDLDAVPARKLLQERGLKPRCTVVSGSFFEGVPPGADAYVLKHVIHDWPDTDAVRILRQVHAAMAPNATVLIVEAVLPEGHSAHPGKLTDLEMLVSTGGRERGAHQFRELLATAGFTVRRIIATAGPVSIVEARPS